MMVVVYVIVGLLLYFKISNVISYNISKKKILESRSWDLNICCGKTDGGGVNADIYKHTDVPNFRLIDDIYNLPFSDNQFQNVLCSHTMEHVEEPHKFFKELQRVSKKVTVVVPPLYDITAVLNFFEHKWIFLSFGKKHSELPKYIKLPFARIIQKKFGQII